MNKLAIFALVFAGACALAVEAGVVLNKEESEGASNAFKNLNFFANLIENNQKEAEKQLHIMDAFKTKRDQFQKAINANKDAPLPRPMNREVDVYLHDGTDDEQAEDQLVAGVEEGADEAKSFAQEPANSAEHAEAAAYDEELNLGGLFSQ